MNYPTVFDLIAEAIKETNVRLILIGGFAVNACGVTRNTQDVDFLMTDAEYQELQGVLSRWGYEESVRTDIFAKRTRKTPGDLPIDFLFVDKTTFEDIWRNAQEMTVSGHAFKVPSLLHLMALKLHAIKQGSKDRVWKDLPDVINLAIANKTDVSAREFVEICRKYGPEGVHKKILEACRGGFGG